MWGPWVEALADDLACFTELPVHDPLFAMMGYQPTTHRVTSGGGLIATPMTALRVQTGDVLVAAGASRRVADAALATAWRPPDPVELAAPLCDLGALMGGLQASGRRVAIATSDDRAPTLKTIAALGIERWLDAVVCADDGPAVKPARAMVDHLCAALGASPAQAAMVGDSPADLAMGRAAGAGIVIGVLSGAASRPDLDDADLILASVADLVPWLSA